MPAIDGDQLRGHLEMLVLAALERGEAHGLEILRRLEESGCGMLRLREGSLYPALYRLERGRQISGAWEKSTHGRRGAKRRIYRLTPRGRRTLGRGRSQFQGFVRVLTSILEPTSPANPGAVT